MSSRIDPFEVRACYSFFYLSSSSLLVSSKSSAAAGLVEGFVLSEKHDFSSRVHWRHVFAAAAAVPIASRPRQNGSGIKFEKDEFRYPYTTVRHREHVEQVKSGAAKVRIWQLK